MGWGLRIAGGRFLGPGGVLELLDHLSDLELGPGTVGIAGWRGVRPSLRVETRWRGPLETVLELLSTAPLSVLDADQSFLDATGSTA